jgi:hypothetical protein
MTTAPNGELRRQDFHLQVQQLSRTLKVRGGIISLANKYLSGFCFSQRSFPPQIIQLLLLVKRGVTGCFYRLSHGVMAEEASFGKVVS